MAKGSFETKPDGDKKIITIDLEGRHKIKIRRPKKGDPDITEGIDGPFDKPPLDLNDLPPDTIIFTHTNPTCGYYFWNGKWWYK